MKNVISIVKNISNKILNSIVQKERYNNPKEFLTRYKNDDDTFLFI